MPYLKLFFQTYCSVFLILKVLLFLYLNRYKAVYDTSVDSRAEHLQFLSITLEFLQWIVFVVIQQLSRWLG